MQVVNDTYINSMYRVVSWLVLPTDNINLHA